MPIDTQKLYPRWNRDKRLQESITRKALDLGEDMQVQANRGVSGWALAAVAAAGLAAVAWMGSQKPAPVVPPVPPAVEAPADRGFKVLHYDQHGNLIDVPVKD